MFKTTHQRRFKGIFRSISAVVLVTFLTTGIVPPQRAYAQELNLPAPGTMLKLTNQFMPATVKGIKIDPKNPLSFVFLINPGQTSMSDAQKKIEYRQLVKYFLAALTTPEKDMWVNLSPYEKNRVIANNFGETEMGRDMLGQDYLLKQLTASLVYPEDSLGKKFWEKVYSRVQSEFGGAQVPVNTFNKVWIVPQSATIYEKGNVAMVVKSRLKVLMEEDYLAMDKSANAAKMGLSDQSNYKAVHSSSSQVMKEVIIPEIEREVNEGSNFAQLRQMYNSMILASWFKGTMKQHLLTKVYANQNKNAGVEQQDPQDNERIYQQYIKAFKKGVYNYIKEETDPASGTTVPRKYFSGGFNFGDTVFGGPILAHSSVLPDQEMAAQMEEDADEALVALDESGNIDVAMDADGQKDKGGPFSQVAANEEEQKKKGTWKLFSLQNAIIGLITIVTGAQVYYNSDLSKPKTSATTPQGVTPATNTAPAKVAAQTNIGGWVHKPASGRTNAWIATNPGFPGVTIFIDENKNYHLQTTPKGAWNNSFGTNIVAVNQALTASALAAANTPKPQVKATNASAAAKAAPVKTGATNAPVVTATQGAVVINTADWKKQPNNTYVAYTSNRTEALVIDITPWKVRGTYMDPTTSKWRDMSPQRLKELLPGVKSWPAKPAASPAGTNAPAVKKTAAIAAPVEGDVAMQASDKKVEFEWNEEDDKFVAQVPGHNRHKIVVNKNGTWNVFDASGAAVESGEFAQKIRNSVANWPVAKTGGWSIGKVLSRAVLVGLVGVGGWFGWQGLNKPAPTPVPQAANPAATNAWTRQPAPGRTNAWIATNPGFPGVTVFIDENKNYHLQTTTNGPWKNNFGTNIVALNQALTASALKAANTPKPQPRATNAPAAAKSAAVKTGTNAPAAKPAQNASGIDQTAGELNALGSSTNKLTFKWGVTADGKFDRGTTPKLPTTVVLINKKTGKATVGYIGADKKFYPTSPATKDAVESKIGNRPTQPAKPAAPKTGAIPAAASAAGDVAMTVGQASNNNREGFISKKLMAGLALVGLLGFGGYRYSQQSPSQATAPIAADTNNSVAALPLAIPLIDPPALPPALPPAATAPSRTNSAAAKPVVKPVAKFKAVKVNTNLTTRAGVPVKPAAATTKTNTPAAKPVQPIGVLGQWEKQTKAFAAYTKDRKEALVIDIATWKVRGTVLNPQGKWVDMSDQRRDELLRSVKGWPEKLATKASVAKEPALEVVHVEDQPPIVAAKPMDDVGGAIPATTSSALNNVWQGIKDVSYANTKPARIEATLKLGRLLEIEGQNLDPEAGAIAKEFLKNAKENPGSNTSRMRKEAEKMRLLLNKRISEAAGKPQASYGGIDFDDTYLEKNITGEGMDVEVLQGFDWLLNHPISGFTPRIVDIHSGLGFTLSFFNGIASQQLRLAAAQNTFGTDGAMDVADNRYGRDVLAKI